MFELGSTRASVANFDDDSRAPPAASRRVPSRSSSPSRGLGDRAYFPESTPPRSLPPFRGLRRPPPAPGSATCRPFAPTPRPRTDGVPLGLTPEDLVRISARVADQPPRAASETDGGATRDADEAAPPPHQRRGSTPGRREVPHGGCLPRRLRIPPGMAASPQEEETFARDDDAPRERAGAILAARQWRRVGVGVVGRGGVSAGRRIPGGA